MDVSGYSVEELEVEYSPSAWCQRMKREDVVEDHCRTVRRASQDAVGQMCGTLDVPYGPSQGQRLDIFKNKDTSPDAPMFVFIHGGYWQAMSKEDYSFIGLPLVTAGALFVAVEYDLAPLVSVTTIVKQIRNAVEYLLKLAMKSNSRGVYLCGHSAGAQLVSMALSVDWSTRISKDCNKLIKAILLISGVFDLRPLVKTSTNEKLSMTEEEAWLCSPMNSDHVTRVSHAFQHCDVLIVVGENDSPQFHQQSLLYDQMLKERGVRTRYLDIPVVDHFTVVEHLDDSRYSLTQEMIAMMKLTEPGSTKQ